MKTPGLLPIPGNIVEMSIKFYVGVNDKSKIEFKFYADTLNFNGAVKKKTHLLSRVIEHFYRGMK